MIKISQYADDTTLILDVSNSFLLSPLSLPDDFCKVSGLRLNNNFINNITTHFF